MSSSAPFGMEVAGHAPLGIAQIRSIENRTEKAASATITRKINSTTDCVVRRPTLSALPDTLNPS